jgi:uncharacterized protein GlcG (DUF336 family)
MLKNILILLTLITLQLATAHTQTPAQTPAYGPDIDLAVAKTIMEAAEGEARKQQWPVAIAIVDTHGHLVMFQRLENTQYGSIQVALEKASTAAMFRRETKVFEDMIAQGGAGLKALRLPAALGVEGGVPVVVDGKVIGGIGVSGVQSTQDAEVARAGLRALTPDSAN